MNASMIIGMESQFFYPPNNNSQENSLINDDELPPKMHS